MNTSQTTAKLAVEYWKLLRAFERALERLPSEHAPRTAAQLRYSAGRLDSLLAEGGLNLVTFEGRPFEPNLPVTALNAEDFAGIVDLVVESTVEPAVVADMKVLLWGKVIVMQRIRKV
jgi:hypothetical protein